MERQAELAATCGRKTASDAVWPANQRRTATAATSILWRMETFRPARRAGPTRMPGRQWRVGEKMIKAIGLYLSDGTQFHWDFDFSIQGTMRVSRVSMTSIPRWMRLEYCQCPACTLDTANHPLCPVAEVLGKYAHDLANYRSYEIVNVDVFLDNGETVRLENIPLQTVVSELVRLAVFQYECPIGRLVKPAMSELPPFPSNDEILSAFARAFEPDIGTNTVSLSEDQEVYLEALHDLFGNLSVRLEHLGQGDAHLNGVVILHSLAVLFTLSAPDLIEVLRNRD
jgi:hypothetical protein